MMFSCGRACDPNRSAKRSQACRLPPWTVYFYWISPFAYGIRAIVVNEFTSPRWQDLPSSTPGVSQGDAALGLLDFYTSRKWVWIGIAFNFGAFIALTQLSAVMLRVLKVPQRKAVLESKEQAQENLRCGSLLICLETGLNR